MKEGKFYFTLYTNSDDSETFNFGEETADNFQAEFESAKYVWNDGDMNGEYVSEIEIYEVVRNNMGITSIRQVADFRRIDKIRIHDDLLEKEVKQAEKGRY
jgi:hypothetical protein